MTRIANLLPLVLAAAAWTSTAVSAITPPGPRPPNAFVGDATERALKFELDVSLRLLALTPGPSGIYAAYRQRSRWDVDTEVRPFRVENNFRPEVGLAVGADTARRVLGEWPEWLAFTAAYVHESNGLESEASRGWNRVIGTVHIGSAAAGVFGSIAGWAAFRVEDTNDDLRRHAGDGELRVVTDLSSWIEGSSLHLRSAFSSNARHGSFFTNLEAGLHLWPRFLPEWVFPAAAGPPVDLVVEWFVGSGEFLYDYRASTSRVRVGLALRREQRSDPSIPATDRPSGKVRIADPTPQLIE